MNNNVKNLTKFFEAENSRNWPEFEGYLHPQVMRFIHTEDSNMVVAGREEYMDHIYGCYKQQIGSFTCDGVDVSASGNRIVANLSSSDGSHSVCVFDFEDGMIRWEHDFLML